jgi:radical SAM protein with 4Fe4S-binding SPASM domain
MEVKNMYENLNEVEKKFKMSEFPLNVAIEVGNHCNLNCTVCANDKITRKRGFIDIFLYKKIIDEISHVNPYTRIWLDYYGEPLLARYKLYYMIDYAKKKGLKSINLNTNGTLLNKEMAEMILDSGIDFISIDVDGFTKEVYEKIRVGASRDVLYDNIEHILKRKEEQNLKKPIIEVKVMEMNENRHEIDKIINYWRERGAWTTIRRLISWGGNCKDIKNDEICDRIACGNAVGICGITWEGDVINCVMDVDASLVFGNVYNTNIQQIWKERNQNMVTYHMSHEFDKLPTMCQNCTDWKIVGEMRYDEKGNEIIKNYQETQESF